MLEDTWQWIMMNCIRQTIPCMKL